VTDDLLNEAGRPLVAGSVELAPTQLGPGEHLKEVHQYFRAELSGVMQVLEAVREQRAGVEDLRAAMEQTQLRENVLTFGAICGQACQHVTLHHRLEDRAIFSVISAMPGYKALIDKLMEEHVVIHDILVEIDQHLFMIDEDPAAFEEVAQRFEELQRCLLSHFAYEDEQLPEPMGVLGLGG
jgi:DNA repair ATPase RecN